MTMESENRCSAISPKSEDGQSWQCDRQPGGHGETLDDPHEAGWTVYWSDNSKLHYGLSPTI